MAISDPIQGLAAVRSRTLNLRYELVKGQKHRQTEDKTVTAQGYVSAEIKRHAMTLARNLLLRRGTSDDVTDLVRVDG